MAMPEREIAAYEQIEQLIDRLPLDKQEKLRQRLNNKTWARRWDALIKEIDEQSKNLPPLTEDEIAEEVMAYRSEQRNQRDKGSN